ncbi:hypothetical protein CW357_01155 [Rummeliibacillus sp. TYF005]|uniref:geobacillin-26 family protein n=1 Tax=Rummeliibacillus sp. TYF005 TaxID=2058214 RepID=UPI000F545D88|nr:geobacillin-26 family protein [Rummeliibacillus sp. TYF005]RPJ97303.1 hypothetical protein CW357_01155 [Rummeliibacillus sp. TYF005]
MKKFISILSAIILCVGVAVPFGNSAKAESIDNKNKDYVEPVSGIEVKILEDNEVKRVVETTQNGEKTISTYNKLTSEMSIEKNGVNVFEETISDNINVYDSNLYAAASVEHPTNPAIRKTVYSLTDSIFDSTCKVVRVSYKTTSTTYRMWTVGIDKKKVTTKKETSKNIGDLQTFKGSVKDIVLLEDEFAAAGGTAYTSVIVAVMGAAATVGVATVVGALTAAGAGITCVGIGVKIYQTRKDQELNYDTIIH